MAAWSCGRIRRQKAAVGRRSERRNQFMVAGKKDVTGHVTGLTLTSVNKFLAYNMIDESKPNVTSAVENLADAITHARFVGSDPSSDEVVLMKILDVLRILILSKVGLLLTNESIYEIMQSTPRICFEPRLSELLLKTSQHCLTDMVQLLFTRLPTFTEHQRPLLKKLKMRSFGDSKSKKRTKVRPKKATSPSPRRTQSSPSVSSLASQPVAVQSAEETQAVSAVTTATEPTSPVTPTQATASFSLAGEVLARSPSGSVADLSIVSDSELENVSVDLASSDVEQSDLPMEDKSDLVTEEKTDLVSKEVTEEKSELEDEGKLTVNIQVTSPEGSVKDPGGNAAAAAVEEMNIPPAEDAGVQEPSCLDSEFTNPAGVTFSLTADSQESSGAMIPTGLPAVYELFGFLASLINPYEQQNSEHQIGLGLVNSALEVGVDAIGQFPSIMGLVKDELAIHLIALLSSERVGMFSSALRSCFLVFNSLRGSLKFQLENFLVKLINLISSESARVSYEHKELALELLVMLYKVPGFITELYLNYDCDLYTSNLFEDIRKVLSKNAFPLDELLSTNHLALEGLLVILNTVEKQCQRRILDRVPQPPIYVNDETIKSYSCKTLDTISENTSVMAKASGYMFASNLGEETTTSGPIAEKSEVAVPTHENLMAIKHKKKLITTGTEQFNINPMKGIAYLQENRLLVTPIDPREVAHFLRENPHLDKNMIGEYISQIDEALRQFLECFCLPGEVPVISLIVEIFAKHWHKSNGECLADADSPYTLSYAVIMLNTDQHNVNASKTNIPMTCEQFIKNLRGRNGGGDHDPEMLTEIYQAIKGDEIVMPAEQKGLVKENYLWKMLHKRGSEHSGDFLRTDNGMFDHNLFGLTWGPSIASLSYVFDRSNDPEVLKRSLDGFSKTAMIAAHYAMSDVLDKLIISLTKFTTLLSTTESPDIFKIMYGANAKALLATRAVFSLTHKFGDILREGWKNLLECLLQLFKCQLLPKSLMEAEDYIESSGRINLFREKLHREKEDRGLINSLVSFIVASSEAPHSLTAEEEEHVDMAKKTILECHPEHLLSESKFQLTESLQELVMYLVGGNVLDGGDERADEHVTLFYLELVTRITVANRDRVGIIWRSVSDHLARLISASAGNVETNFQNVAQLQQLEQTIINQQHQQIIQKEQILAELQRVEKELQEKAQAQLMLSNQPGQAESKGGQMVPAKREAAADEEVTSTPPELVGTTINTTEVNQNMANLSIAGGRSLANIPPSECPKAKPSRKIDGKGAKKSQLQAALQQHSQQLAQLDLVLQQRQLKQQNQATLAALLQNTIANQQQLTALQQNVAQLQQLEQTILNQQHQQMQQRVQQILQQLQQQIKQFQQQVEQQLAVTTLPPLPAGPPPAPPTTTSKKLMSSAAVTTCATTITTTKDGWEEGGGEEFDNSLDLQQGYVDLNTMEQVPRMQQKKSKLFQGPNVHLSYQMKMRSFSIIKMLLLISGIEQNPGPTSSDSENEFQTNPNEVTVLIKPTMTNRFNLSIDKTWTIDMLKIRIRERLVQQEEFYNDKTPQQLKLLHNKKELTNLKDIGNKSAIQVLYIKANFVAPFKQSKNSLDLDKEKQTSEKIISPSRTDRQARSEPKLKKLKRKVKNTPQLDKAIAMESSKRLSEDVFMDCETNDEAANIEKDKCVREEVKQSEIESNQEVKSTGNERDKQCSTKGCTRQTWHTCTQCRLPLCNIHSKPDPKEDNETIRIHLTDCSDTVTMSKNIQVALSGNNIKAPSKPKKAFGFFLEEKLQGFIGEPNQQRKLTLQKTWKALSKEERVKYENLAKDDLDRYQNEMRIYSKKRYVKKKLGSTSDMPIFDFPEKPRVHEEFKKSSKVRERKPKKRKRQVIQDDGCGVCKPCCKITDCDKCVTCLDKRKNGGERKIRKRCVERVCVEKRPVKRRIDCDCESCQLPDCGDCDPCRSKPKWCKNRVCLKPKENKCKKCKKVHKAANFCCKCKKTFKTPNLLNKHVCPKGIKCKQCDKVFSFKSKLEEHVRTAHKVIDKSDLKKRKKCQLCNKTFCNNQILRQHNNQIHLGIKKDFVCDICGKPQYSKSYLESHKLVHQQGFAFKCSLCNKTFTTRRSFTKHNCDGREQGEQDEQCEQGQQSEQEEQDSLQEGNTKSESETELDSSERESEEDGEESSDFDKELDSPKQPIDKESKEAEKSSKKASRRNSPKKKYKGKSQIESLLERTRTKFSEVKERINMCIENGCSPSKPDLDLCKNLKLQEAELEKDLENANANCYLAQTQAKII